MSHPDDRARMDFLESLMSRREYQNARRPSEGVGADMHFNDTWVSLYLRDLCGVVTAEGQGTSVRACIDAAMAAVAEGKDDAVRKTPRIQRRSA